MSEENTVLTGQEESAAETSAAFDEGFDDDWSVPDFTDGQSGDDDGFGDPETDTESEGTEADADQQEAEGTDGEGTDGGDEGGPAVDGEPETEGADAGSEGSPDQGEFVLKHLGEERTVNRDEVVVLAQKGMDYDRIREKWDGVKDDVSRLRMYEDFLGRLAQARGGTGNIVEDIEALIDETNTRTLLAQAEAEGRELTPSAAAAQAVKLRTGFVPAGAAAPDPEEARAEKGRQEIERFLGAYPDVKAEDIPKEVWDDVNRNDGDLLGAYQRYENRQLKEKLKGLEKELEETKQQKKNKARSTGSAKSVGSAARRDAFDEGWDYDK